MNELCGPSYQKSEGTCLRLYPILYLNDVSFFCPLAALPHQSFYEDLSQTHCLRLCKQNHQPNCVMAVTDVPGDTSVPCMFGVPAAARLAPRLPPQRRQVLAGGHPRTGASLFLPLHTIAAASREAMQGLREQLTRQTCLGGGAQLEAGWGRLDLGWVLLLPHLPCALAQLSPECLTAHLLPHPRLLGCPSLCLLSTFRNHFFKFDLEVQHGKKLETALL